MLLLPYLYDRQIGSVRKFQSSFARPDLDCLLSRLVCGVNDVFITRGEDGTPVPPFTCKFRKDKESDLLAVANEDGEVYLIDTDKGKGVVKNFTAHNNAIFDICWLPDRNGMITGSGDFRCCLFDMYTCKKVSTFKYHTASIKSVDVFQDGSGTALAAGSKDGSISIWDIREDGLYSKPAIVINQAHERTSYNSNKKAPISSSVSAVAFKDGNTLASAGVGDSVIKIWDLRKTYDKSNLSCRRKPRESITFVQHNKDQRFGYTSLVFNSLYTKLYACSGANKIFEIDCHSYTKKYERFIGLKSSTSYFVKIALSHDDQYIASGSSDNKAYIWKTSKPGLPLFELAGHTAEVTSVAWGAYNNTKVATCGDDHKVLLWKTKYSDHAPENPDKDQVAASCPYSSGITNDSSDSISIFLPVTPMNHSKRGPNFKSPPTSNNIRSYFSPLPSTPVSRPHSTQSPSHLKRESAKPQSSQSRSPSEPQSNNRQSNQNRSTAEPYSNQNRSTAKPYPNQSPSNRIVKSAEAQSNNQSRNLTEPQSDHCPCSQIVKSAKEPQGSRSPSNLTRDSIKSLPSSSQSCAVGGSGYVYPTIFRNSFGKLIELYSSVSTPLQPSHSANIESSTPHTDFIPYTNSEELSSSVSATQSKDLSGDLTKVNNMQHQSIQSSDNYTDELIPDSQKTDAKKGESVSILDLQQSGFSPNGKSTSALHSNNSLNNESTKLQSSQSETNKSTSCYPISDSTQSSGNIPTSPAVESTTILNYTNSPNSKSAKPQSSNFPGSTSPESISVAPLHFKNNSDIASIQITHSLSCPTTESASNPHSCNSPNKFQQYCNCPNTGSNIQLSCSTPSNIQQSCNSLSNIQQSCNSLSNVQQSCNSPNGESNNQQSCNSLSNIQQSCNSSNGESNNQLSCNNPNGEANIQLACNSPNGKASNLRSSNNPNGDSNTQQSCTSPSYTQQSCNSSSNTQQSCNSPSNIQHSCNSSSNNQQSCNTQQSCNSPSNTQQSFNSPSNTQQSCNSSSNTQQSCNSPSNTQQSCNNSSNTQQSCNSLSTPTVQREPLSPRKNIPGSSAVKGPARIGKENGSSVKKSNGQTKRKLDVNDRACKNHLEGCGRSKGKARCGKRTVVPEKNSLTDYFSVIQTPDKHQNSAM